MLDKLSLLVEFIREEDVSQATVLEMVTGKQQCIYSRHAVKKMHSKKCIGIHVAQKLPTLNIYDTDISRIHYSSPSDAMHGNSSF